MSIDEIEKLARKIELIHEAEKARAYLHDYPLRETDASLLARALLAVLPVVRAAENVAATWDGPIAIAHGKTHNDEIEAAHALLAAIATMRQRLGGAE